MGAFVLAAAMMLGSNACAKDSVSAEGTPTSGGSSETGDTTGDMTTTASESGESDSTGSTEGDTSDSASDTYDTSLSFYAGPDDLPQISSCDPFAQDCPEGEKCVPYGSHNGSWDANKCVSITGDGQAGDPCISGGSAEGTDDCGADSYCWNLMDVDGVIMGECTEFCQGTIDDPLCPAQTSCLIANQGVITLCIESCDPLLQDCAAGLACYWTTNDFNCLFTTSDIPPGESCGYFNDCVVGTGCVTADVQTGCNSSACCVSFCSLMDPVCPQEGTECISFFNEGVAPPQYADVGVCIIPGG